MLNNQLKPLGWAAGLLAATVLLTACPGKKTTTETADAGTSTDTPLRKAPAFNADSAYQFTAKQVSFGPRVPNSPAATNCGDWLVAKFRSLGLQV